MSALVIGSMMPDISYFLGIKTTRLQSHSIESLLTWSLPLGLLMYILFHGMLRQTLTDLLPVAVQARLRTEAPHTRTWRDGLAVAVSLVCGAATHLVWDAFTHHSTPVVDALPFLLIQLGSVGPYPVYGFSVLQHLSSVVGLSILVMVCLRWFRATAPVARSVPALSLAARMRITVALVVVPLAVGLWILAMRGWQPDDLGVFVFSVLPVFFWMLMGIALVRRVGFR